MNPPSELEKYLQEQSVEGLPESQGEFSISKAKALEKMASYQFPFEGAWLLKIIQCAVSSGQVESIEIRLLRKVARINFYGNLNFSLEQLESALFDPEYQHRRDLTHLVTALRYVGFHEKRSYMLKLGHQDQALVWNGSQLNRCPCNSAESVTVIEVSNKSEDEERDFFGIKAVFRGVRRNADAVTSLTKWAHVCPIPLTVDGRRIDSLELSPSHGFGPKSQPLIMRFQECKDLPSFSIPESRDLKVESPVSSALRAFTASSREYPAQLEETSMAYILAAHIEYENRVKTKWNSALGDSVFCWIADGVITDVESLGCESLNFSVVCFLSAEGLATDISGLKLNDSPERSTRRVIAKRSLRSSLLDDQSQRFDFELINIEARNDAKMGSGLLALFGVPMCFLPGGAALGAATVVFGMTLGKFLHRNRSKIRELEESYQECLAIIRMSLEV